MTSTAGSKIRTLRPSNSVLIAKENSWPFPGNATHEVGVHTLRQPLLKEAILPHDCHQGILVTLKVF